MIGVVRDAARSQTKAAIAVLTKLLKSPSDVVKMGAANSLLDRGWGRPTQMIAGDPEGEPVRITEVTRVFVDPIHPDGPEAPEVPQAAPKKAAPKKAAPKKSL